MKVEYAKDPKWANEQQTVIDLTVKFEHFDEELPFSAQPDDSMAHGRELFERAKAGEFGAVAAWTPPSAEQLADDIRAFRAGLLASTDWTQLPDVPQAVKDLWAPYRQALRDITEQAGFPYTVTWPEPPQGA